MSARERFEREVMGEPFISAVNIRHLPRELWLFAELDRYEQRIIELEKACAMPRDTVPAPAWDEPRAVPKVGSMPPSSIPAGEMPGVTLGPDEVLAALREPRSHERYRASPPLTPYDFGGSDEGSHYCSQESIGRTPSGQLVVGPQTFTVGPDMQEGGEET